MNYKLIRCNTCQFPKMRAHSGKRPSGQTIWVDENNKQWSGRKCPSCAYTETKRRSAKYAARIRLERKAVSMPAVDGRRVCRKCGDLTHNYYYCHNCHVQLRTSEDISYGLHLPSMGYRE